MEEIENFREQELVSSSDEYSDTSDSDKESENEDDGLILTQIILESENKSVTVHWTRVSEFR